MTDYILHTKEDQGKLFKKIELENQLNQLSIDGIKIGNALGNNFEFFFKNVRVESRYVYFFRFTGKAIMALFQSKRKWNQTPIQVINYSRLPKDKGIFEPLKKSYGVHELEFIVAQDLCYNISWFVFFSWLLSFAKSQQKVKKQFHQIMSLHDFKHNEILHVWIYYRFTLLFAKAVEKHLIESKPKLLLFTHERNKYSSIVNSVAKKLNVTTANIIHGSCFHPPKGYLPVSSDHLLCWGKAHSKIFSYYQSDKLKIKEVGFPLQGAQLSINSKQLKSELGIDQSVPIILLICDPQDQELGLVAAFKEKIDKSGLLFQPLVKVHPTKVNLISTAMFCGVTDGYVIPAKYSAQEALILADIVIGFNSTMMIEALSFSKPCIVFNPFQHKGIGVGHYIHTFGKAPMVNGWKELLAFLADERAEAHLHKMDQFNYYKELCAYTGDESIEKIKEFINDITQKK